MASKERSTVRETVGKGTELVGFVLTVVELLAGNLLGAVGGGVIFYAGNRIENGGKNKK
jgi:hypothetical protein